MGFLKWAGGKRWLAPLIRDATGPVDDYVEPFLGGGAVFFALEPGRATLSDANPVLMDAYAGVKFDPAGVLARLKKWPVHPETFLDVRDSRPRCVAGRAARFVYLNRTAFNGLYRVNRLGKFNVPYGCKPGTTACDADAIKSASYRLRNADLVVGDFAERIERASSESLIYADPPYVLPCSSGYARYTQMAFAWGDQERLARSARDAVSKGCRVIVSNAYDREIVRLYPRREFQVFVVKRASRMAANPLHRGARVELVVVGKTFSRTSRATFARALESL